jgi:hypothetical protein
MCGVCGTDILDVGERLRCVTCGATIWREGGEWWHDPAKALPPIIDAISRPRRPSNDAVVICTGFWTEDERGDLTASNLALRLREAEVDCEIFRFCWPSGHPSLFRGMATVVENAVDRARALAGRVSYIDKYIISSIDNMVYSLDNLLIGFRAACRRAAKKALYLGQLLDNCRLASFKRVHLVGHSLGARLALDVIGSTPPAIRAKIRTVSLLGAAVSRTHLFDAVRRATPATRISHVWNPDDVMLKRTFRRVDVSRESAAGCFYPEGHSGKLIPICLPGKGPCGHEYDHLPARLWFPQGHRLRRYGPGEYRP